MKTLADIKNEFLIYDDYKTAKKYYKIALAEGYFELKADYEKELENGGIDFYKETLETEKVSLSDYVAARVGEFGAWYELAWGADGEDSDSYEKYRDKPFYDFISETFYGYEWFLYKLPDNTPFMVNVGDWNGYKELLNKLIALNPEKPSYIKYFNGERVNYPFYTFIGKNVIACGKYGGSIKSIKEIEGFKDLVSLFQKIALNEAKYHYRFACYKEVSPEGYTATPKLVENKKTLSWNDLFQKYMYRLGNLFAIKLEDYTKEEQDLAYCIALESLEGDIIDSGEKYKDKHFKELIDNYKQVYQTKTS